jgi:hypothetical protein
LMQYETQFKHLMRVARSEKLITAGSKRRKRERMLSLFRGNLGVMIGL